MINKLDDFVVLAAANEADKATILPDTPLNHLAKEAPWGVAWRIRFARWFNNNQGILQKGIR